jgi:iron complex transport system ATP-binding protein
MSENATILKAVGLVVGYQADTPVLRGIDLEAEIGAFTCILGPNGCGKTTLLKCLMQQLALFEGRITVAEQPLERYSARALARVQAYVPQQPHTDFAFTAGEVVLLGRYAHTGLLGFVEEKDRAIAAAAMQMTDTLQLETRTLLELSGGEAQRVMIARALAQQPKMLLLDEPTSHLDIRNQLAIHDMVRRVAHQWPMCVLCVSHDINLAARFADRLVLMREGQVVAQGAPETVIKREILQQVYDVDVALIDAGYPTPLVQAVL